MICLKTTTFAVSATTSKYETSVLPLLWFAWKQLPLQYQQQRAIRARDHAFVVICLKTTTFAVSATTLTNLKMSSEQLWFAWKQLPLQYQQQHCQPSVTSTWVVICLKTTTFAVSATTLKDTYQAQKGCDLLENNYLCSISNNHGEHLARYELVVICLKTTTFAVSATTDYLYNIDYQCHI